MKEKKIIVTPEDVNFLGFVCIRPDVALRGDVLLDESYVITVLRDGFSTVLNISKKEA